MLAKPPFRHGLWNDGYNENLPCLHDYCAFGVRHICRSRLRYLAGPTGRMLTLSQPKRGIGRSSMVCPKTCGRYSDMTVTDVPETSIFADFDGER